MNSIKPNRPILKLKKPIAVADVQLPMVPVPPVQPKSIKNEVQPPKAQKTLKTKKISKSSLEKESMRLENIRLDSERCIIKKANTEKVKPLVDQYFTGNIIFREIVIIDNTECLKPLMIGARKIIFDIIKNHPDCPSCSNTVVNDLLDEVFKKHTAELHYINGLVKFNERFDMDGNPSGAISEEHKIKAQTKAKHLHKK